jgi:hypothetical protein
MKNKVMLILMSFFLFANANADKLQTNTFNTALYSLLLNSEPKTSNFVNFKGADEDKELVDVLISKYLSVNEPKRIIYVAPYSEENTTDGTGETKDNPRRNLRDALEHAQAGDHFYLAPGVYEVDKTQEHFEGSNKKAYFTLGSNGTVEDKIVVTTDPDLFDPTNGKIAQLDFNFNNIDPKAIPSPNS